MDFCKRFFWTNLRERIVKLVTDPDEYGEIWDVTVHEVLLEL